VFLKEGGTIFVVNVLDSWWLVALVADHFYF
jgi:hypothetical protein